MNDAHDNLLDAAALLAWTGISCESAGKDMGHYITVPCAYTSNGVHLSIAVGYQTCKVTNITSGETFEADYAAVQRAIEVAARNLVHRATLDLAA